MEVLKEEKKQQIPVGGKTKEELRKKLEVYDSILNSYTFDYLGSLLDLRKSVIRNFISPQEKKLLCELEIYREIAIYNVTSRAISILNKYDVVINKDNSSLCATMKIGQDDQEIFRFDTKKSNKDKVTDIGKINLYTIDNSVLVRETTLVNIMKELEYIHEEKFIYGGKVNDKAVELWQMEHDNKIEYYQNLFRTLDQSQFSEQEKLQVEQMNKVFGSLLGELGISFKDDLSNEFSDVEIEKTCTCKKMIKKIPGFEIIVNKKFTK